MQKRLLLPACSHVSQEPDLLTSATKLGCHSLFLPLTLPVCPRRREQDFLFCASAELFSSLVSCSQLGGRGSQGESCLGSWSPWGVCMVRCQKYSVFPACDHGGNASPTAGSGRLLGFQSQVLLEPLYRQIIFAQGVLLLQGDSPVCRGKDLMHTGGLKNPPWPNSRLSPFCWPPHHAMGVPDPVLQSQTWSATTAVLTSCCTWLMQGEDTKPPPGALRMLNAEHTQSARNSCLLSGPAIIPVGAWER